MTIDSRHVPRNQGQGETVTTFRVWAPRAGAVSVEVDGSRHDLVADTGGWWQAAVEAAGPGSDYAYLLDGGGPRPDPRSAWQPHGVHGPSRVVDHGVFGWTDQQWRGVGLPGSVLYELHIGTFTPAGTFDAAAARLDHLVELGVSAVELLPCNAFAGRWGWGYDGVAWFAVHDPYGGPEGLKRFVDACHARGIGVVMDVVYNHLGPAGNYLPEFGPYLTEDHPTPWGQAVNLDRAGSDEVRRHVLDNALMWLRDYHADGLRLDAVHALLDERATHLLEELAVEVEELGARLRKPLFLIAETDRNDPRTVLSREVGGCGFDAQWADDVHHALHANLTGETVGYYADFDGLSVVAKVLTGAFLHDGTWSSFRGRSHGRPVPTAVSGHRFVAYLQNHDQIGNRAAGDRISTVLSDGLLRVGAALVLTSPFTPMLWMGEEWAARTPWHFFSDHEGELGEAVLTGRQLEFASHGWATENICDPQAESTVRASTLDWSELAQARHAAHLAWTRELIALRRQRPELSDGRRDRVEVTHDERSWLVVRRGRVAVVCNLGRERQTVPLPGSPQAALLSSERGFVYADSKAELAGESVLVLELAT